MLRAPIATYKIASETGDRTYILYAEAPPVSNRGYTASMRPAHIALGLALLGAACTDEGEGHIRGQVTILANQEGTAAFHAVEELRPYGRRALPILEAALHTAPEPGRKNLILALRQIGDPDAVPLLRHLSIFDAADSVRREAEWTLKQWAADLSAEGKERAARARAALRAIDEQRGHEEAG
jgi:hypothetical protein